MSLLKSLVTVGSLYGLYQLALTRLETRPPLEANVLTGVYLRQTGNYYIVLRFYPDGLVMSASIKTEDIEEAWLQINQWFHRYTAVPDLSRGVYSLYHGYLAFDTTSSTGTVTYFGTLTNQSLILNSHSRINGYQAKHEVYTPLSVDDTSLEGVYAYTSGQRNHVFRFYEDGTVIQATIFSQDVADNWERIQLWFHPESHHLMLRRGRYVVQGGRVRFILGWNAHVHGSGIRYEGVIRDDSLILESYVSDRISAAQEYRRLEVGQ